MRGEKTEAVCADLFCLPDNVSVSQTQSFMGVECTVQKNAFLSIGYKLESERM